MFQSEPRSCAPKRRIRAKPPITAACSAFTRPDVGLPLGLAPMVVVARDVDRATRVQSTIDQRGDTD